MGRGGAAGATRFYLLCQTGQRGPVTALPHLGHGTEVCAYSLLLSSTGHRCSEVEISPVKARAGESLWAVFQHEVRGHRGPACFCIKRFVIVHCLPSDRGPAWLLVEIGARLSRSPGLRPAHEPGSRSPPEPFLSVLRCPGPCTSSLQGKGSAGHVCSVHQASHHVQGELIHCSPGLLMEI